MKINLTKFEEFKDSILSPKETQKISLENASIAYKIDRVECQIKIRTKC